MKINKKIKDSGLETVLYIVIGFVIAYAFNMGLGLALSTETPVVSVFSESMVPTLQKGDLIVVKGSESFEVGDIIVFDVSQYGYPIIHRIIDIDSGEISTKGDHNSVKDPWKIKEENIHGKAILKVPILGWVKIVFTDIIF